jgi:site-specific recombinase XerD
MNTPKAYVTVKDFKAHIESFCDLRKTMQHQDSSIEASRKDLKVFTTFCKEKNIRRITGLTLVNFFSYVRNSRHNGSGSINRKRSTLRCYFQHLRLKQVKGAKDFPIEHLPRARQPYSGPVNSLETKEVEALLNSIDRSTAIGLRDFTLFSLLYALGLRLGEALRARAEINLHFIAQLFLWISRRIPQGIVIVLCPRNGTKISANKSKRKMRSYFCAIPEHTSVRYRLGKQHVDRPRQGQ